MAADLRLVSFLLVLVGGLLGLVSALRPVLRFNTIGNDVDFLLLLAGGVIAMVAAGRGHGQQIRDAGILGVVGGALMLLGGHELGGVLALVGGVLYLMK